MLFSFCFTSNLLRIKKKKKKCAEDSVAVLGHHTNVKTGKIKKMTNNGFGYLFFTLYDKKLEKPKNYRQHRFVYEVFKGVIPRCLEIDHINNIKTDNRIKNLQIISHKKNVGKSKNKSIISINIKTCEKKRIRFYYESCY